MKTLSTTKKLAGLFITLMTLLLSCTLVGCSGSGGSYDEQSGVTTSKMDWNSGFTNTGNGAWAYKEADGKLYIKRTCDNFAFSIKNGTNCGEISGGKTVSNHQMIAFDVNGEQAELTLWNPVYGENASMKATDIPEGQVDSCTSKAKSALDMVERASNSYKTNYKGTYCFEYDVSKERHSFSVFDTNIESGKFGFYVDYTPSKSDTKNSGQRYSTTSSNIEDWANDFEFYGVVE